MTTPKFRAGDVLRNIEVYKGLVAQFSAAMTTASDSERPELMEKIERLSVRLQSANSGQLEPEDQEAELYTAEFEEKFLAGQPDHNTQLFQTLTTSITEALATATPQEQQQLIAKMGRLGVRMASANIGHLEPEDLPGKEATQAKENNTAASGMPEAPTADREKPAAASSGNIDPQESFPAVDGDSLVVGQRIGARYTPLTQNDHAYATIVSKDSKNQSVTITFDGDPSVVEIVWTGGNVVVLADDHPWAITFSGSAAEVMKMPAPRAYIHRWEAFDDSGPLRDLIQKEYEEDKAAIEAGAERGKKEAEKTEALCKRVIDEVMAKNRKDMAEIEAQMAIGDASKLLAKMEQSNAYCQKTVARLNEVSREAYTCSRKFRDVKRAYLKQLEKRRDELRDEVIDLWTQRKDQRNQEAYDSKKAEQKRKDDERSQKLAEEKAKREEERRKKSAEEAKLKAERRAKIQAREAAERAADPNSMSKKDYALAAYRERKERERAGASGVSGGGYRGGGGSSVDSSRSGSSISSRSGGGGAGKKLRKCSPCNGSGELKCTYCKGKGKDRGKKCTHCERASGWNTCKYCKGSGER